MTNADAAPASGVSATGAASAVAATGSAAGATGSAAGPTGPAAGRSTAAAGAGAGSAAGASAPSSVASLPNVTNASGIVVTVGVGVRTELSNGAGVSGCAPCAATEDRRAGGRCGASSGPSSPTTMSSKDSHAVVAWRTRSCGSLTSSESIHCERPGSTSGRTSIGGGIRSLTWRMQDHDRRVGVVERHVPDEQLVGQHADRVEVGPGPDVAAPSPARAPCRPACRPSCRSPS